MNTFRIAPWYLKLMLLILPLHFALRFTVVSPEVLELFNHALRDRLSPFGLTIDFAGVIVAGVAAWAIWHPRPASRWALAVALLFSFGYQLIGALYLPRISADAADEASVAFHFGKISWNIIVFGWAYLCVFGERALDFFHISSASES